jgi:hypothetical protein
MQTVPFEKVAAAEAMEFAAALAVGAPKGAEIGSAAFDEWLLEQNSASSVSSERMPLVLTFCRLVLWHHKRIAMLRKRGAYVSEQGFDGGVPCSVTGEVVHFAVLLVDEASRPLSLRSHLLREEGSGENAKPISSAVVFVHERFGFYVDLAKHLCKVCASKVRFVLFHGGFLRAQVHHTPNGILCSPSVLHLKHITSPEVHRCTEDADHGVSAWLSCNALSFGRVNRLRCMGQSLPRELESLNVAEACAGMGPPRRRGVA